MKTRVSADSYNFYYVMSNGVLSLPAAARTMSLTGSAGEMAEAIIAAAYHAETYLTRFAIIAARNNRYCFDCIENLFDQKSARLGLMPKPKENSLDMSHEITRHFYLVR